VTGFTYQDGLPAHRRSPAISWTCMDQLAFSANRVCATQIITELKSRSN